MARNKYPEETRSKVLDAATKLFLGKGYAKTTVLDIVANMDGLTRGAFYHHFKSKEDVLTAIFARLNEIEPGLRAEIEGKNGLEKLRTVLRLQNRFLAGPYKDITILLWALAKNPEFLVVHLNINKAQAKEIKLIIEEGIADGSIAKEADPAFCAEFTTVLLNFWLSPVYFSCTDEEMKGKLTFIKRILDGIGCPVFDDETLDSFIFVAKELSDGVKKTLENLRAYPPCPIV